jgi:RNA polymerase subunit RPABC4/transcription elongation factor Spt4
MLCKNCGSKLNEDSKFCKGCGTKVEAEEKFVFCENCGNKIKETTKFCKSCGAKAIQGEEIAEVKTEPVEPVVQQPVQEKPEPIQPIADTIQPVSEPAEPIKESSDKEAVQNIIPTPKPKPKKLKFCKDCDTEAMPNRDTCHKCGFSLLSLSETVKLTSTTSNKSMPGLHVNKKKTKYNLLKPINSQEAYNILKNNYSKDFIYDSAGRSMLKREHCRYIVKVINGNVKVKVRLKLITFISLYLFNFSTPHLPALPEQEAVLETIYITLNQHTGN